MNLSNEKMESLNHISTKEIENDLRDARMELESYQKQSDAIESAGVTMSNKVTYYFLSAKISKGKEFIDELEQLLEFREVNKI